MVQRPPPKPPDLNSPTEEGLFTMQTPTSQKVTTVAEKEYRASNDTEDGAVVKGKVVDTNAETVLHFVEEDNIADLNYDVSAMFVNDVDRSNAEAGIAEKEKWRRITTIPLSLLNHRNATANVVVFPWDREKKVRTLKEKEEVVLLGACMVERGYCQGASWDRKRHAAATSLEFLSRHDIDNGTRGC
ncbi:hypothetical protein PIB30_084361 [Stylosanthes scabra]|uniref:Uncharacterized protein n=1 Tax=Stylosanthes scabra TaxID=79078 RepID=A0ABU6RSU2_9FABA|nr:hypothetical protein [Stylosanthes scabra]